MSQSGKRKYYVDELPNTVITFDGRSRLLYSINDPERLTVEARSLEEAYFVLIDKCWGDYLKQCFGNDNYYMTKIYTKEELVKKGVKMKMK